MTPKFKCGDIVQSIPNRPGSSTHLIMGIDNGFYITKTIRYIDDFDMWISAVVIEEFDRLFAEKTTDAEIINDTIGAVEYLEGKRKYKRGDILHHHNDGYLIICGLVNRCGKPGQKLSRVNDYMIVGEDSKTHVKNIYYIECQAKLRKDITRETKKKLERGLQINVMCGVLEK